MVTLIVFRHGEEKFRYTLRSRLINLGRSSECDLVLADSTVSTLHANILQKKEGYQLVDLGSTNGTYLNGKKIDKETLKHNDVIAMGPFRIRFVDEHLGTETGATHLSKDYFENSQKLLEQLKSSQVFRDHDHAPKAEAREAVAETLKDLDRNVTLAKKTHEQASKKIEVLEEENRKLIQQAGKGLSRDFLGESVPIRRLMTQTEKVAPTDMPLLITGETGTGKSILARHIHEQSARREHPFVTIDCASIPSQLLESELFGHEKGAFTGAVAQKKGRIEAAEKGTLFLDEIGDMPQPLQAKLLRLLQDKCFERVGGTKTLIVDTRIIAATNKDLKKEVEEKRFREDLYYRLCGMTLHVPPLRQREADAMLMAQIFLDDYCVANNLGKKRFTPETRNIILHNAWEGNVRQLKHAVESAALLCEGDCILPENLELNPAQNIRDYNNLTLERAHEEVDRKLVNYHLQITGGNYSKTAKALGIDRGRLARLMEKYGIEGKKKRDDEDDE